METRSRVCVRPREKFVWYGLRLYRGQNVGRRLALKCSAPQTSVSDPVQSLTCSHVSALSQSIHTLSLMGSTEVARELPYRSAEIGDRMSARYVR